MTLTALLATIAQSQTTTSGVKQGVTPLPSRNIFGLTSDNSIYVLRTTGTQWSPLGRIDNVNVGNIIGIDFRPADNSQTVLYALTDRAELYRVNVSISPFQVTRVSSMATRFTGGFGNVMDFNPVANALRVTGTNDQNLAVVDGTDGTSLSSTVAQTRLTYAAGDPAAGQDPEITGGAYSNNFVGATSTIFYMIDHARDTLVTIATLTATGSSNTGGGVCKTIGGLTDTNGRTVNMGPNTDFDIYTDGAGRDFLVGHSDRVLFAIDLSTVSANLPVGQTQRVVVRRGVPGTQLAAGSPSFSGGLFDIAIPPRPLQ